MKKIAFFTAALLLAATLWSLWALRAPAGNVVEILQDGKLIQKIDLKREKGRREIVITAKDGGVNRLLVENGRIRVKSADCPGKDCVRMGWLRSASLPLVCLPHRLTVRFAEGSGDSLDSISQ
ncbi:MAG: NusG domain II-containing protein [Pyramidobacter sp.]|jgi:hypothetical protein